MRLKRFWKPLNLAMTPSLSLQLSRSRPLNLQMCRPFQLRRSPLQPQCLHRWMSEMILVSMRNSKSMINIITHYMRRRIKIKCPYCDAVSMSLVNYEPSMLGYLLTMIAMLFLGIIAMILMPFLVSLTKTAIHRCARCLNAVQDNSYFGMSSLDDKLFTW